jgi:hypothetical protein
MKVQEKEATPGREEGSTLRMSVANRDLHLELIAGSYVCEQTIMSSSLPRWCFSVYYKSSDLDVQSRQSGSCTSDSVPSEARKRGSGGGSPRRHDDLLTDP